MNTEKIEKLKRGLNNSQIPESLKEKIRQQISRLEDEDKANQPVAKAEIEKIEDKIEEAVEVAEKKEEQAEAKKPTTARKPRAKKVVEPKAKTVRKPRAKKVVEPKTTTANKKSAMALAKEIRKPNEKWNEAVKRAGATMRGEVKEATKKVTSELEKLKAFVKRRKELKTIAGTNLLRDSKRKAKPRGSRTVTRSGETSNQYGTFDNKLGRKYSENRENRTDRLAPNYPKNAPLLAGGGGIEQEQEYLVVLQHSETGDLMNFNVLGNNEENAIDNAYMEADLNQPYEVYSVKKYATGGGVDYYEQLTVYVIGVGTLGSGTSMKKAIDKAREYERKHPNAEIVIVDEKYGDEYDTDGNLKEDFATGGGVDNLPRSLKTRLNNLKGRVTISKAQALKAYELHSERGMGGSTIGYEMFDAKNKRDSETFGDLAIDLGRHYSQFANGGYNEGIEEDIDMTDDYVLRVNKGVEPKDRASMKDWMAKTNESREAMTYELGGAFMETDLAGHTGGGTGGLNANMPLSGVSGTHYTDLVGETGALSSAEMFDGGGRVKNEELISYETFLITEKNDYDKAIDSLIVKINKSLSEKGMPPITTNEEYDKESEYQERVYVDDNVMIRIWSIKNTKKGYLLDVSVFKEHFAKGGMFAGGGSLQKGKIKNWYMKNYRTDTLGKNLDADSTFEDVWTALNNGTDVYSVFGVGDSLIRERIFTELAKIYNVDYDYIYYKWLDSDDYARGGGIRKVGNREYPLGRNWTNDHNQVNKSEEHETSYNRKRSFANGGAMMANQQIIDNASQQYVNYYLGEGASTGMYKDGGAIQNQYKGRTPRDIWNNLTKAQRHHFLHDHEEEILENKKLRYFTNSDLVEFYNSDWFELDDDVKNAFGEHTSRGEYAGGGEIRRFDRHEEMDGDTRTQILDAIRNPSVSRRLENYLFGLFDGYDYSNNKDFKLEMKNLKSKDSKAYKEVVDIYEKVDKYNFKNYKNYATGGMMHNHTEMEDSYARGGGIRTVNGREYSTGRNWTNDHKHHNKAQDYEVPMSKRR